MQNQENDDEKVQLRKKDYGYIKRLNLTSEVRPKSLITYETGPVPQSPSATGTKITPPVLAKARSHHQTESQHYPNLPSPNRASLGPLEDLVVCGICLEKLKNAKMLNCQHTFCLECLQTAFTGKKSIICPICSTEQEIPDSKNFNDLPSNLYIDSLLKLLIGSPNTNSILIQPENDLEVRCIKCQTICTDNYQNCRHCKQNFCHVCWNDHLIELSKQINNLDKQLNSALEKIDHKLEEIKDRSQSLKKHIKSHAEEQITIIKQKEQILNGEADKILKQEIELSEPIIKRIQQLKKSIKTERNNSDSSEKVSSFMCFHKHTTEIFSDISKLGEQKSILNKDNFSIDILSNDGYGYNDPVDYEPIASAHNIKRAPSMKITPTSSIESVKDYYSNKIYKSKFIWAKCPRPAGIGMAPWVDKESGLRLLYITGSDNKIVYAIETMNGRIIQKLSNEEMIFPNSLCFSPDRREIYVTDKWKHCIFVFSDSGEWLRCVSSKGDLEGFLRSPEGIAYAETNVVVVCDTGNDRIQYIDIVTGKMIQQIGLIKRDQILRCESVGNVSISTDLKAPTGIAVYDGNLIVLDSGNRRVKIFSRQGEILKEFGTYGDRPGQFKYPEVLAVDIHGYICVGDGGNTKVQVFQPSGKLLTSFGIRGTSTGKFSWISGVSITPDLQIIVSDYKNHTVQIFS